MLWTQPCPSLTRCSTVSETTTLTTLQRQHAAVVADIQMLRRKFYLRNIDLVDHTTAEAIYDLLSHQSHTMYGAWEPLLDEVQAQFERNTGLTGI